ncbi:hypothetical protein FACS1894204_08530 [Synergistales bacterium]|nr:hypothetical protein FACS1894204_08530 [Synergistales bacterium]
MPQIFQAYGKEITFNDTYVLYNSLKQTFTDEALAAEKEFAKKYASYGSIETFVQRGYDDGLRIIQDVIQRRVIDILIENQVYNIDANVFVEKYYYKNLGWKDSCDNIIDEYKAIGMTQAQLDAYRTQRRQNRGKFAGMGFGIGGAIEASVKAGALNLATGAAHGIFNVGAKVLSAIDESSQKSSLYNSEETKKYLQDEIWNSVYRILHSFWNVLRDCKLVSSDAGAVPFLLKDNTEKAAAIINNMSKMGKEAALDVFPEVLLINPYNKDLYMSMLTKLGDKDGELEKISTYFGVASLKLAKKNIIEKLYSDIKPQLLVSEEKALTARNSFVEQCQFYGHTDVGKKILGEIDAVLTDYDVKARTVDGFLLSTREEANEARKDLARVQELLGSLDYEKNENDAIEALKRLEGDDVKSFIVSKYIEKLKSLLIHFDEQARTVLCEEKAVIFETREEAAQIRETPEFQVIKLSYQKYIEHPEEVTNFPSVLKNAKTHERIRAAYAELFDSFRTEQKEVLESGKVGVISRELIIWGVAHLVVLIFTVFLWNGLGWLMQIILGIFIYAAPAGIIFAAKKAGWGENVGATPSFACWGLNALSFSVIRWDQWGWIGFKSINALIIIGAILAVAISIDHYKKAKKAQLYLKDEN